jgi:hypothetical protein
MLETCFQIFRPSLISAEAWGALAPMWKVPFSWDVRASTRTESLPPSLQSASLVKYTDPLEALEGSSCSIGRGSGVLFRLPRPLKPIGKPARTLAWLTTAQSRFRFGMLHWWLTGSMLEFPFSVCTLRCRTIHHQWLGFG